MKIVRRDFVSGRARADHFCHGKKSSTVAFGCDVSLFLLLPRLTVTFQAEKETNRVNWRPRMGSPAASRKVLHPFLGGSFAFFNRISFSSGRSFFPNVFPATSCRRGRVATRWGHYANTIQQRNPVNPADTLWKPNRSRLNRKENRSQRVRKDSVKKNSVKPNWTRSNQSIPRYLFKTSKTPRWEKMKWTGIYLNWLVANRMRQKKRAGKAESRREFWRAIHHRP